MGSEGLANGLRPALDPLLSFKPLGVENAGVAIDVRSQEMQMIEAAVTLLSWHLRGLIGMAWRRIHKNQCMCHP